MWSSENNNMDKCLEKVTESKASKYIAGGISECIEDGQSEIHNEEDVVTIEKVQYSEKVMLGPSSVNVSQKHEVEGDLDKLLCSEKSEQTRGLEAFHKAGRRGWLREVVLSRVMENQVVHINYFPPGDHSGRKKFLSCKEIETYLAETNDSSLTRENFSFARKVMSLGGSFELIRISSRANFKRHIYQEFFQVIKGSSPLSVSCNLCEGKTVAYTGFSWHMKHYHLPDENCNICHHNIPAINFKKHSRICDGAGTEPKVLKVAKVKPAQSIYSKFYTELDENVFFPAKKARVVCNLCAVKTVGLKHHYSRHFKQFHLPDQTCTSCGKDIPARRFKNHMTFCNGEGEIHVISKSQNNSEYYYCEEQNLLEGNQEQGQVKDRDHKEDKGQDVEYKMEINRPQNNDVENPSIVDSEFDVTLHEASQTSNSSSSASEIELCSETDSE